MADHDLSNFLDQLCPVGEWDECLIGFEPCTQPVDPRSAEDVRSLRTLLEQHDPLPRHVVVDRSGMLCLWRKVSRFWD